MFWLFWQLVAVGAVVLVIWLLLVGIARFNIWLLESKESDTGYSTGVAIRKFFLSLFRR